MKFRTPAPRAPAWEHFLKIYDSRDVTLPIEQQRIVQVKCTLCQPPNETVLKWYGTTSHMNDHLYSEKGHKLANNSAENEEDIDDDEGESKAKKPKFGDRLDKAFIKISKFKRGNS